MSLPPLQGALELGTSEASSLPQSALKNVALPGTPAVPVMEVHQRELANGLNILVQPDHTAPVVSVQYWCGTGSIHEGQWLGSGLSHLLEHLMFKGTPSMGNSQMAQRIQDLGGHMNAYTSFDRTVYYVDLPSQNWAAALDIWTDSMQNSCIPAEEFEPEKEVIRREFAMGDDSPDSVITKLIFRTAFTTHPYRFPVIGHLDLFDRLTREDVLAYYHERYSPQNLTLIVVGDVDPSAVFAHAQKVWKDQKRRFLPDRVQPQEPFQQSPRFVRQSFPTEVVRLASLYQIPGLGHPDIPALQILSILLGSGRSSVLHRKLVEEEGLAEEIDTFTYAPATVGLFGVDARCSPQNHDLLLKRIRQELAAARDTLPAEVDLERARRLCLTQAMHQLKTVSGRAASIGSGWMLARDPLFSQAALQHLQKVTGDQVQTVARKYLHAHGESLVELVPTTYTDSTASVTAASEPEATTKLVHGVGGSTSSLRTLYFPSSKIPLISFRASLPGGLLTEPADKSGLCRLTTQMLLKGTAHHSSDQLSRAIEGLGGHLNSESGNNSAAISLELLAGDWEQGLDILLEILTEPEFTEKELATEKRKQLAAISVEQDQPMAICRELVKSALFGSHPYSRSILGTRESVESITLEDVQRFAREVLQTREMIFSVAGPLDEMTWQPRILSKLSGLSAPRLDGAMQLSPALLHGPRRLEKSIPKEQAIIQIAYPIPGVTHGDQIALGLVNEALADLGTRLFVRIREQLGLAYFVSAGRFLGKTGGYFVFYAGTDPKRKKLVEEAMQEEIQKLVVGGLTSEEVERARAKVLSEDKINAQNPSSVVAGAALDELLGVGFAYHHQRQFALATCNLDEINSTITKTFQKETYVIATVSPE